MKNKNLLVTLADENYVEQAKQLFSSVYWNAGWKGDYMLLAHEIPEKKLKWFRDKGILVKKCKPIFKMKANRFGRWPIAVLSKFYLFTPEFKNWGNIVYLDSDIIVRASLDELTKIKGFAAVLDDLIANRLIDQFLPPLKIEKKIFNQIKQKYDINKKVFNAGIIAFRTDIIKQDTFFRLKSLTKVYEGLHKSTIGDQLALNLFFYKRWKKLPIVYNLDVKDFRFINPNKINAIILHFSGCYKPWFPKNPFYEEWNSIFKKANKINLKKVLVGYNFKNSEIEYYSKYLKRRFFGNFQSWIHFIDYQIGSIGIFLYDKFPKLYFKLKKIKSKITNET